jgi:RND family efflux transporter MFP subunit
MKRPWAAIVGTATCLIGVACGGGKAYDKPLTPVRVETVEVSASGTGGGVRFSASVEPRLRVDLAFKVPGYVEALGQVNGRPVQEGDLVAKGTLLASLRASDYEQKVSQARSQLAEADAGAAQAKAAFERARELFARKSISKPDYEQAKGAYDMVQAKVSGASALVREAELAQGDSALKAPIDGLVVKKLVDQGALVGPGTPAFVLADTRSVKVIFGATDTLVKDLRRGTQQRITTEALPGREFQGQITRIAPAADFRSRVFDVEVTIPNPDRALKVGMVAALRVAGAHATDAAPAQVAVPLTAVVRAKDKPDSYGVFVTEEKAGKTEVRFRTVSLGEAIGNKVAVTAGLAPGERIVVAGTTLVADGEPVRIVR